MPSFYSSIKNVMELTDYGRRFLELLLCDFSGGLKGDQMMALPKATY